MSRHFLALHATKTVVSKLSTTIAFEVKNDYRNIDLLTQRHESKSTGAAKFVIRMSLLWRVHHEMPNHSHCASYEFLSFGLSSEVKTSEARDS
jgi:hypothetical protein